MYLSIRMKLLLALISIVAAGYVAILFYLSRSETEVLKKRAIEQLKRQASYSVEHLELNLQTLSSEVQFLSRLEIMDDILANDIDKRVYNLLKKRVEDLKGGLCLAVFDNRSELISSVGCEGADPDLERANLSLQYSDLNGSRIGIYDRFMIISSPIYASFDQNRRIGALLLYKPLASLMDDLYKSREVLAWIVPPKKYESSLSGIFRAPDRKRLSEDFLSVFMDIGEPLEGWKIGYAIKKEVAYKTIEEVQRILLVAFLVMLALLVGLVLLVDRRIAGPIRMLSQTASKILSTGDYGLRAKSLSRDEIGDLAQNFNALMQKTGEAFDVIENQSRRHAQTLTELMRFFGRMIESETKEETLERACEELKRLTSARRVYHTHTRVQQDGDRVILECRLVREGESKEYGNIVIEGARERVAMQKRFFEAAARMIALQIERIELLQTTTEALKSKTSFFSALSHELRTPLGSILSLTQYLATSSRCDDDSVRETLGKIENSAGHLLQIINDILLMAKAESGKLEPMMQQCDSVSLVRESVEMVVPLAEAKGVELAFVSPEDTVRIDTDPKLFRQVLINLLANAVKYTNEGSIVVEILKREDRVEVSVTDTGIGIEPEALERIFDEFYREHRVEHSEYGSGLGLTLSKKIALALGGDLLIESEGANRGTKALFILYE